MSASLRNRVALTLAGFGAAVSFGIAGVIYVASYDLERRLIDDTLNAELQDLVDRQRRNPQSVPEHTVTIRAYVVSEQAGVSSAPSQIMALGPGQHRLTLGGEPFRALVRQVADRRFVVLYQVAALRRREQGFVLLLAGSVILITAVSAWSGRRLASLVIAPVTDLARRVGRLRPEDPPPRLASEFPWIEVQRLAADFDVYLARLHAFIERERLFTGDISHELRTPIAVIGGATELLFADPGLSERNQARVARIGRAVAEMGEMTGALLALAREQDGSPAPEGHCDTAQVVGELVERYSALFRDRSVRLHVDLMARPRLPVDRAVLSMVLGNLLRNALNFTNEGEVRVRVLADGIEVLDTGTGIGDADVSTLFNPYVRGATSDGAGLGLSLVQRLCERHGWQVTLSNLPEGGTLARWVFAAAG